MSTSKSLSGLLAERQSTDVSPLLSVFNAQSKVGKFVGFAVAAHTAFKVGKDLRDSYKSYQDRKDNLYSITITSSEDSTLHAIVSTILRESIPGDKFKRSQLSTVWMNSSSAIVEEPNFSERVKAVVAGCSVTVTAETIKEGPNQYNSNVITIFTKSHTDKQTILEYFRDCHKKAVSSSEMSGSDSTGFFRFNGLTWRRNTFLSRSKESVILPEGVSDAIYSDLNRFLDAKDEYRRFSIPWHRGYLLYGPPGTGKSSTALAIASTLDLPVFTINLSAIKDDNALTEAFSRLNENQQCVLILEDIDIAKKSTSIRDSDGTGVSLGALLNALDGADTPDGLVTIMTTNNKDNLDPALVRPGRVDFSIELGYLSVEQAKQMVDWYLGFGSDQIIDIYNTKAVPAGITGIIKNNFTDKDLCLKKIIDYIEGTND